MKKTKVTQILAVHEAAHCYLICLFRNGPEWVKLYNHRNPEIQGKVYSPGAAITKHNRKAAVQEILICLAGASAELLLVGYAQGFESDTANALATLKCIKSGAKYRHLRLYVEELLPFLGKPRTWGRIMALADRLLQKNKLTGKRFRRSFAQTGALNTRPSALHDSLEVGTQGNPANLQLAMLDHQSKNLLPAMRPPGRKCHVRENTMRG